MAKDELENTVIEWKAAGDAWIAAKLRADHGAVYVRHQPGYNGADHNRQTYLRIKGGAVEVPRWLQ